MASVSLDVPLGAWRAKSALFSVGSSLVLVELVHDDSTAHVRVDLDKRHILDPVAPGVAKPALDRLLEALGAARGGTG